MLIQKFRNREKELKELNESLESNKFEFLVIYGRRRIGKTELILKATENKKRIYYLAVGAGNLERFYTLCTQHYPEVSKLKEDWEALFEFLKTRVDAIIIDEFQNMIKEDENILNIFQSITDIILKDSKVKLFLLGSSVSMITSRVLDYKSPLYGRRTGSMELKAVSFFDLRKFYPQLNAEDLMDIYGFTDGIPFYLIKIDKTFWSWLQDEIKKEKSFLKDEVDFLMRYEFADVSTYKLILEGIACGKTKVNEIKDYIKLKRTDLSPYLRNLSEVKMIRRVVPITENVKSRMGRYYLSDNFLKFWFRYIYPNLSSIEEGIFDASIIRASYNTYLGYVFEDASRQFLIKRQIFRMTRIGKWWHKDKEIDIVALNESTNEILFAECKWKYNVNAGKILHELKEKAQSVQWNNDKRKEHYAIFAKSFKEKIKEPNLMLFDLNDFL
ncbi:MAG: ATP-binding protein [archaeon]|nr:ATP-binding protein [archaeon]